MISAMVQGVLTADPAETETRDGRRFVTATARVPVGDGDPLFVGIAALEPVACERLARLVKGSAICAGRRVAEDLLDRQGR